MPLLLYTKSIIAYLALAYLAQVKECAVHHTPITQIGCSHVYNPYANGMHGARKRYGNGKHSTPGGGDGA